MPADTLILFIPACFALNMAFGPNNLLSMTIGAKVGLKTALYAAAGRMVAFIIMIAIAALGMGALLMASELAFWVVKLLGAVYLVWLGIKILRSPVSTAGYADAKHQNTRGFVRQEFIVAISNPKAVLIFTAFFPQFVSPEHYWLSFLILGAIFLLFEMVAIALYAYAGTCFSGALRQAHGLTWVNRISGVMMIGFGCLLALARR